MHVLELDEPAVEGDRLAGPERAHDVDGLVEPRTPLLHGDAAGIELCGELAAYARPEHEPSAREMVDRDDLLRDRGGGAQRHQVHAGTEGQPLGYRRRVAQAHERVEDRRGVRDVLAAPQRVESHVLGQRDRLADLPRRGEPRRDADADGVVEWKRHDPRYPGVSSKRGRSSVISCHGAFDATKM